MTAIREFMSSTRGRLRGLFRTLPKLHSADDRSTKCTSAKEHVIIGGCGRSGTTLVRLILDSHPNICCGPESKLFLADRINPLELANIYKLDVAAVERIYLGCESRAQFIDHFSELCCVTTGKSRWAEKTPRNILNLAYAFATWPRCKFVHVLRDGRDVTCSLRTHPRHRVENGQLIALDTWNPIETCIARWRDDILASKPFWSDPRVFVLRYEQLVTHPRRTIEELLKFLGEEWDDILLSHDQITSSFRDPLTFPQNPEAVGRIGNDALGRWHRDLTSEDKEVFKKMAGDLLIEFGYAQNANW